MIERVVVIAPHPDDEVLGAGGTIAKLASEGADVHVAIVTRGMEPQFTPEAVERTRAEARDAHRLLGVRETHFLDFPAAALDTVPHRDVNSALLDIFDFVAPASVFVPFPGDIHLDHQLIFQSTLVASRPSASRFPSAIYAYETLSETNWNAPYLTPGFHPTVFVDISAHVEAKMAAMRNFATQLREAPNERSIEALQALATLRGATVGVHAAEAFVLVRQVIR